MDARLAIALALVVPLKLAAEKVVKQLVQRERPGTTVPDAILRGVHPGGLSLSPATPSSPLPSWGCWRWCCHAAGRWSRSCSPRSTPWPGCIWGRTTRWTWSAGRPVGLAIAAVLDLILAVARDRGGRRRGPIAPTREDRSA
jgi:hypothetical protein